MRIGIFANPNAINANYRAFPLAKLGRRGHEVLIDVEGASFNVDRLRSFDVVFVYRDHDTKCRKVMRALRDAGVALVWDNDDDLAQNPLDRVGALTSQREHAATVETLRLAHLVTTTSNVLATQYAQLGAAEVRVVENHLPSDFFRMPARDPGVFTIGWTAAAEHSADLERIGLKGALLQLLDRHPRLRVETLGIDLRLPQDRYRQTRFVQFRHLPDAIARFDVGIAPLADTAFNRARSNVKLKEYAAVGLPWLASPVGPYRGLGEKQGGRLVGDGDWFDALDDLIRNEKTRRKLAKNGGRWARTETADRHVGEWEAALERAVVLAREARPAKAGAAVG